ncbi:HGGxSTG domain-containing protein [Aestuariivirga sp.]|uniref:HGGxSTG domain-containing protein n=1 Tax=Aestuariivirga sp. TaxID=2650926 RepID=UPI003015DFE8
MEFADLFTVQRPKLVCGARTRRGTACQCKQLFRKGRCRFHGGLSTGPRTAEGREAISRAVRARWAAMRGGK